MGNINATNEHRSTFGQEGRPDLLAENGPMVVVQIGFDPGLHPGDEQGPNLSNIKYSALVDTGTRDSCIDSNLAMKLNLPILGQRILTGIHGPQSTNIYGAQVYIPELNVAFSHQFAGGLLGNPPHVLIGRDLLQNFTMIYEGQTGVVRISRGSTGR